MASAHARAAVWMLGALVSFLAMALGGRELAVAGLSTFQILFFRSVVGLIVIGSIALRHGVALLRTHRIGEHVWRNVAHFGGQFGWFFAIATLPLAEVFAIEFTIPVWTALLGYLLYGEAIGAAAMGGAALILLANAVNLRGVCSR